MYGLEFKRLSNLSAFDRASLERSQVTLMSRHASWGVNAAGTSYSRGFLWNKLLVSVSNGVVYVRVQRCGVVFLGGWEHTSKTGILARRKSRKSRKK